MKPLKRPAWLIATMGRGATLATIPFSRFRHHGGRVMAHSPIWEPGIQGSIMKALVLSAFVVLLGGCMSMRSVDLSPGEVREQVRAGQFARPGDHISVTMLDGSTQAFKVTQVTDRAVRGEGADVPIDSIVSLRRKQIDRTKTALTVVGAVAAVYVAAAVDAMYTIIDSIGD
ncbi:MAG: hypothetical protein OXC80_07905 [Gammaproteobacteria bacterium]|nr:hypothetical protein [Gammaproteobacteria bacterium]